MRERLARTRWPDPAPGGGWAQGTELEYLRKLVDYWRTGFDWRKQAMSTAAKAMSRGPAWPVGTPSGSFAQVLHPHEQTRRCFWYSVTIGLI